MLGYCLPVKEKKKEKAIIFFNNNLMVTMRGGIWAWMSLLEISKNVN